MSAIRLATGPVTWGVDFADAPGNPPWEHVLDEIAASDVGALELGPVGYLPEDPAALRAALDSRGLTAVGSFVFDDFHDPSRGAELVAATERAARAIASAGGAVLLLIDRPSPERAATAGRSLDARRLDARGWAAMLDAIRRAAAVAEDHGLRPAVHPHAGSYVEYEDEIERLLDDSDLALCLDTGHAAYAGIDADRALVAYGPRLAHVHLKDVRADVVERGLGFWAALAAGVFCPLGEGAVDLAAVLAALDDIGYEGYATIEQDRVPGSGSPLDDLAASVRVLSRAGVADAPSEARRR
ncbi:MAG: inosose dehydratase [Solirubrobacteraceae bacterium]